MANKAPKQPSVKPAPKTTQDINNMPFLDYRVQSNQEMMQLDTQEDMEGLVEIDNVVKKARDVYGTQPNDMKSLHISWEKYGVTIDPRLRPSPFMFPAFEKQAMDLKKYQGSESRAQSGYGAASNADHGAAPNADHDGAASNVDYGTTPETDHGAAVDYGTSSSTDHGAAVDYGTSSNTDHGAA